MRRHLAIASILLLTTACDDTVYRSGVNIGDPTEDPAPEPDSPTPEPVPEPEPDLPIEKNDCIIEFDAPDKDPFSCEVDVRDMLGCEALARCACIWSLELDKQNITLEQCIESLVLPRGAITLADVCAVSGTPISPSTQELMSLSDLSDVLSLLPFPQATVTYSPECSEVAAFTLYGEQPGVDISLSLNMAPWPNMQGLPFSDVPKESPPLATFDDIRSYERATATIRLTEPGSQRLKDRWADPDISPLDLAGWPFAIHTEEALLVDGQIWSRNLSRLVEGIIIYIEDTIDSDYLQFRIERQTPEFGPFDPDGFGGERFKGHMAAAGKLLDAACISSCGCSIGWGCREGICTELPARGCLSDGDCCQGLCVDGTCE